MVGKKEHRNRSITWTRSRTAFRLRDGSCMCEKRAKRNRNLLNGIHKKGIAKFKGQMP